MNINAKILDKFDRKVNIYELIRKGAERAHALMSGAPPDVNVDTHSIHRLVMEELVQTTPEKPKDAPKGRSDT